MNLHNVELKHNLYDDLDENALHREENFKGAEWNWTWDT